MNISKKIKSVFYKTTNKIGDIKTVSDYDLDKPMEAQKAIQELEELLVVIKILGFAILGVAIFAVYQGTLQINNYASTISF